MPLLIDSGIKAHNENKSRFSFELFWLKHEGFYDMISKEWKSINTGRNPIERWKNKIRHLRRFLKGWAKSMSGNYKKEKERLISLIDNLDLKAETIPLSQAERATLKNANEKITKLRRDEETKWAQRATVKHIQQGGSNTKYFHLIANGKKRKYLFYQLEQEEGTIVGDEDLKVYISEFYKKLFGDPIPSSVDLIEDNN
jgi:mannosylglycoprotein endo-beta-mannosidase